MENNRDHLVGAVATLYRWRKQILWTCLAASVGTALIAFLFMDNYYKSTTVFYVASPDMFKPEQLFGTSVKDMEYYGTDDDVDRIITIAESGELKLFLIKQFDLYKHYDIDTANSKAPFKVMEHLDKLYDVVKTKRNAVELSVEDKDKGLSARMANAARDKVDEFAQRLIRESQSNNLKILESDFNSKQEEMKGINDTLTKMRSQYGVYDLEKQAETMTSVSAQAQANLIRARAKLGALEKASNVPGDSLAMLRAMIQGYEAEMKNSDSNLKRYGEGMNGVSLFAQLYKKEREQLAMDRERYIQLKTAYGSKVSAVHLIESAPVPIEKSRPKRSLIILSAFLIALIVVSLGALLFDTYRDVDWKEEFKD